MSEWQPIETAPKDGTKIVAWGFLANRAPEMGVIRSETPVAHVMMWRSYTGLDAGDWVSTSIGIALAQHPTHWMPLPAPPEEAEHGT
jgi:hypothetical protein